MSQLLEQIPQQTIATNELAAPELSGREAWLQQILGTDIEHARPFIDQFAYNPETGEDALRHVLSGDIVDAGDGNVIATGFHHEPSAGVGTYVDRNHLEAEGVNAKTRQNYSERPFEPYRAKTVVGGYKKSKVEIDENGAPKVVQEQSSMFPKEYDPLAVIKTIVFARDSRDKTKDILQENGRIATEGHWFMLDDKTMMRMNIILDPNTEKIITAIPRVRSYMNLTPSMIDASLGLT